MLSPVLNFQEINLIQHSHEKLTLYFPLLYCFYVSWVAEESIALVAGGFFDDVEIQQVIQHLADGRIGKSGQFFQFGYVGYRVTEHCLMYCQG